MSLSVRTIDDGRLLIHSFAGDSFVACVTYLGADRFHAEGLGHAACERVKSERRAEADAHRARALDFCERVWRFGQALEGTIGARYLESRAIGWAPADVAFHPAAPRGYSGAHTAPALIALVRSVTGAPKAIQATYLRPDGAARTGRATFGGLVGGAVRLAPVGPCLAVAEGLETAASFGLIHSVPTWATLGASNLEAFHPPACVRRVVIGADGDAAGMKAALTLAERLRRRCDVTIRQAPEGRDWNDVAAGGAYG